MTLFKSLCHACGLTQVEAASYLGVSVDTVKSWSAGRSRPPETPIRELHTLANRIQAIADQVLSGIERYAEKTPINGPIALKVFKSNRATLTETGLPYSGCQDAVNTRIILALPEDMAVAVKFSPAIKSAFEIVE